MSAPTVAILLSIALACVALGKRHSASQGESRTVLTISITTILLVSIIVQHKYPELLPIFRRDIDAVREGQVYRLFTALWFQDGWMAGCAFNLIMLYLIGGTVEKLLQPVAWLTLYFLGGFFGELLALSWAPNGAGNSIGCCSLAGGLASRFLVWPGDLGARILAIAILAAGGILASKQDIHGGAVVIGFGIGSIGRLCSLPWLNDVPPRTGWASKQSVISRLSKFRCCDHREGSSE